MSYLQNYKEFEAEILDLQLEKYGLSFDIKKCTTSCWALGDENVIGIRSFKSTNIVFVLARYTALLVAQVWDSEKHESRKFDPVFKPKNLFRRPYGTFKNLCSTHTYPYLYPDERLSLEMHELANASDNY